MSLEEAGIFTARNATWDNNVQVSSILTNVSLFTAACPVSSSYKYREAVDGEREAVDGRQREFKLQPTNSIRVILKSQPERLSAP